MASEPKWEKWRLMDCARLYEWVALLARLDPDSIRVDENLYAWSTVHFRVADENFWDLLRIAESSVIAGTLTCHLSSLERAGMSEVLMPEFLRWARSKGLTIPPELAPAEGIGTAASAADATSIQGIDGLRDLINALGGPVLGSDPAAVRSFAKKAGVMKDGDNPLRTPRTWSRAEIEPMLKAAIESWRQRETK
ncbi:hypothetical protein [Cystobacter ferrugineus]|nr:hypothetical protein [Cystobacter ferrugineus]